MKHYRLQDEVTGEEIYCHNKNRGADQMPQLPGLVDGKIVWVDVDRKAVYEPYMRLVNQQMKRDYRDYYGESDGDAWDRQQTRRVESLEFMKEYMTETELGSEENFADGLVNHLEIERLMGRCSSSLTACEKEFILMRYVEKRTIVECAEILHVHRKTIHDREKNVIRKIKKFL